LRFLSVSTSGSGMAKTVKFYIVISVKKIKMSQK
jgi:hypothetical protein